VIVASEQIYTVSELTTLIKEHLEESFSLVHIEGEISNFRVPSSGHFYFTLKDEKSQIRIVMFRMYNRLLQFKPENGIRVILKGRVTVYEPRGEYQIVAEWMEPAGRGSFREAFDRLKEKLQQEGLFDDSRKKKIPFLPGKIAIVTSPTGAAVKDILNILKRRFANVEVTIYPTRVQGAEAAREITDAIAVCNERNRDDVIIVTRGGGSIEDLWPFNEEIVARALAASSIPTISAVGHEIDFTISDFVADLRAATPSAAAEMVIESEETLLRTLASLSARLTSRMSFKLEKERNRIYQLFESKAAFVPINRIRKSEQQMDDLEFRLKETLRSHFQGRRERLLHHRHVLHSVNLPARVQTRKKEYELYRHQFMSGIGPFLNKHVHRLEILKNRLHDLNPERLLEKGYAICRSPRGKVIKSAAEVRIKENVNVTLHHGLIFCTIYNKDEGQLTVENSTFGKGRRNHEQKTDEV